MPHLHSSLGENFSAGMTLTPTSYRSLFEPVHPRIFDDATLLDDIIGHQVVDLGTQVSPEALGAAPSFTLVASPDTAVFRRLPVPGPGKVHGELRVNPLYTVEVTGGGDSLLTLTFPNPEYEEEFGECRRYLPQSVVIPGDARGVLDPAALGVAAEYLRRTRVVIDAPRRYC
jgi:hypothetical protein